MVLPDTLSNEFWNSLKAYEQEKQMTYITSVEEIGIKAGKEKGRQETEQRIVLSMLKKGISVEDIAEITELSIEQVKEIQSQQQ